MILGDIAQGIWDTFSGMGDAGMLLALGILVWIDGTAFPTLPEAWLVAIIEGHTASSSLTFGFGVAMVLVATTASLAGTFTLYLLVRVGKLPKRISRAMQGYTRWLVVNDERVLILNRLAPLIPYTGAFIAVNNWNVKKSALYVFTSGMAKMSAWIIVFAVLNVNLADSVNHWVSLGVVAVVITASIVASLVYKRKKKKERSTAA